MHYGSFYCLLVQVEKRKKHDHGLTYFLPIQKAVFFENLNVHFMRTANKLVYECK